MHTDLGGAGRCSERWLSIEDVEAERRLEREPTGDDAASVEVASARAYRVRLSSGSGGHEMRQSRVPQLCRSHSHRKCDREPLVQPGNGRVAMSMAAASPSGTA